MARSKSEFHDSILYHGSDTMIPVGDIVEPRNSGAAYATTNEALAHTYALVKGKGKGFVHEVEPLEDDNSLFTASSSRSSKKGFRVTSAYPAEKEKAQ